MIDDMLDAIADGFSYLISFEWLGALWEFIGSMFENLSDFSIIGTVLGLIGFATIFIARDYMLNPFLIHMGPAESVFWAIVTHIGSFIGGYMVGKHFENT